MKFFPLYLLLPLTTARPLSEYCPSAVRPLSSILPYSTYRSAQLPCTVEYCKHHGRADGFPAATCADTGGGEWVTRPSYGDDSGSGGLSTEEKYYCGVASAGGGGDGDGGARRTYLARSDSPRTPGWLDAVYAASRNTLDTTKFVTLPDGDLLYWLRLSGGEARAVGGSFKSLQPLLPDLKVSPEIDTADPASDLRISFDGEADIPGMEVALRALCGGGCQLFDTSSKYGKEVLFRGVTDVKTLAEAVVGTGEIEG